MSSTTLKQEVDTLAKATNVEYEQNGPLPPSLSSSSPPVPTRSTLKSVILVLTCTFAMIVNSANGTAVSISLPTIGRELNIQEAQLQWLVSAYPLSSGCLLLIFGRLADLYGRKRSFILGSLCLAAFTLACGFAQDSITLDVLRGFQGVGAAATIPASLGILAQAFPPSRARSIAFSTFAAGAPVGAAFGMAFGGALTELTAATWRSPFYMQCGLTVLCLIGGVISVDPDLPTMEADTRVDWLGAFLVTAGLVLVVFVLGQGAIAPQQWATPYIVVLLIVGILMLVAFAVWQDYLEKAQADPNLGFSKLTPPPLMKISLWGRARGRFAAMMLIAFLTWCAFLSWNLWVQLYYQDLLRFSPLQTVARLMPMFITGVICNIIVAFVVGRVSVIYLIASGPLLTTTACLLFAVIDPSASYWAFGFPSAVLSVVGADFVFAAGTLFIAKVSLPHEQSLAGALFQTMTQLGTAVGLTVTTVVFNRVATIDQNNARSRGGGRGGRNGPRPGPFRPRLDSYQAAQWTAFGFGFLATILAILFFRGVGIVGHRKGAPAEEEHGILTETDATITGSRVSSMKKLMDSPMMDSPTLDSPSLDTPPLK